MLLNTAAQPAAGQQQLAVHFITGIWLQQQQVKLIDINFNPHYSTHI